MNVSTINFRDVQGQQVNLPEGKIWCGKPFASTSNVQGFDPKKIIRRSGCPINNPSVVASSKCCGQDSYMLLQHGGCYCTAYELISTPSHPIFPLGAPHHGLDGRRHLPERFEIQALEEGMHPDLLRRQAILGRFLRQNDNAKSR